MSERTTPLVLYVDDEHANRMVFEQTFGRRFNVKVVASGDEALTVLEHERVAVLVTDQRMPGMSGNELLERVKHEFPTVIRAVITAYSDLNPILRAVNEGLVARYIIKPWDRQEVDEMLGWALEAYQLGGESSKALGRLLATERLATLGTVYAGIHHDMAQPLAYLLNNSERLAQLAESMPTLARVILAFGDTVDATRRRELTLLVDELPAIAREMLEGCRVINGLKDSVQSLLRPGKDSELLRANPVRAIQYAVSACAPRATEVGARVVFEGPWEVGEVQIGVTQLIQALLNLIGNALDAIEAVDQHDGRVRVTLAQIGEKVRIRVSDNGPGMNPDLLRKAGHLFFTTREHGTGLGLSQCRRLVEGAGGELRIESVEGSGTEVSLWLKKGRERHPDESSSTS